MYLFVGLVVTQILSSESIAQNYPNRTIRFITGSPTGGGGDFTTRLVAQRLSQVVGVPIVVENRPGASQSIAAGLVAKSLADGYTLAFVTNSINATSLMSNLPYSQERDLTPVVLGSLGPNILMVHPSVPARSVKELIALARAHPGNLKYGSAGVGSSTHLSGELFNYLANVKTVHVPYKGGVPSLVANASGEVEICYIGISSSLPMMSSGRLRGLAVTSMKRSSQLPAIPTISEAGVSGYNQTNWYGMFAPAAVPRDIVIQLNAATNRALNTPEAKEALSKEGLEFQANTPEQFAAYLRDDIELFLKLARLIGLKAE